VTTTDDSGCEADDVGMSSQGSSSSGESVAEELGMATVDGPELDTGVGTLEVDSELPPEELVTGWLGMTIVGNPELDTGISTLEADVGVSSQGSSSGSSGSSGESVAEELGMATVDGLELDTGVGTLEVDGELPPEELVTG